MFPFLFNHSQNEKRKEEKEETSNSSTKKNKVQDTNSIFSLTSSLFQNKSPIFQNKKTSNQNQQSPSRKSIPLSCNTMTPKVTTSFSHNTYGTLAFLKNEAKSKFTSQSNKPTNKTIQNNYNNFNNNNAQTNRTLKINPNSQNNFNNDHEKSKNTPGQNKSDLSHSKTNTFEYINLNNNDKNPEDTKINQNVRKRQESRKKKETSKNQDIILIFNLPEIQTPIPKQIPEIPFNENFPINSTKSQKEEPLIISKLNQNENITNPIKMKTAMPQLNSEENFNDIKSIIPNKTKIVKKNPINDIVMFDFSSDSNSDQQDDPDDFFSPNARKKKTHSKKKIKEQRKKEKQKHKQKTKKPIPIHYGHSNVITRSQEKATYALHEIESVRFYQSKVFDYFKDEKDFENDTPIIESNKAEESNSNILQETPNYNFYFQHGEQPKLEQKLTQYESKNHQQYQYENTPLVQQQQSNIIINNISDLEISGKNNEFSELNENENQDESLLVEHNADMCDDENNFTHNQPIENEDEIENDDEKSETNQERNQSYNHHQDPSQNDQEDQHPSAPRKDTDELDHLIEKRKLNFTFYPSQVLDKLHKEKASQRFNLRQKASLRAEPNESLQKDQTEKDAPAKFRSIQSSPHTFVKSLSKYLNESITSDMKSDAIQRPAENEDETESESSEKAGNEFDSSDFLNTTETLTSSDFPSKANDEDEEENDPKSPKNSPSTLHLSNQPHRQRQFVFSQPLFPTSSSFSFEQFLKKRTKIGEGKDDEKSAKQSQSIPNSKSVDNSFKSAQVPSINTTEKAINRLIEISKNMPMSEIENIDDKDNSKISKSTFIPPFFKDNHPKPAQADDADDISKYNEFERAIFSAGKKSKWQASRRKNFQASYDDGNGYKDNSLKKSPRPKKKEASKQKKKICKTIGEGQNDGEINEFTNNANKSKETNLIDNKKEEDWLQSFVGPDNEMEPGFVEALSDIMKDDSLLGDLENQQKINISGTNDVDYGINKTSLYNDNDDEIRYSQKPLSTAPKFRPVKKIILRNNISPTEQKKNDENKTIGMILNDMIGGSHRKHKETGANISPDRNRKENSELKEHPMIELTNYQKYKAEENLMKYNAEDDHVDGNHMKHSNKDGHDKQTMEESHENYNVEDDHNKFLIDENLAKYKTEDDHDKQTIEVNYEKHDREDGHDKSMIDESNEKHNAEDDHDKQAIEENRTKYNTEDDHDKQIIESNYERHDTDDVHDRSLIDEKPKPGEIQTTLRIRAHPLKKITDIISTEKLKEMQQIVDDISNSQPVPQFDTGIETKFKKEVMEKPSLIKKSIEPFDPD